MNFWNPQNPLKNEDLSAEEIRQLWRSRFRQRLLILGLPSLLILIIVSAWAFPRVKDWRARQFATRADSFRLEGKLQEAFSNASSAMQMRPTLPESQRALAAVLFAAGKAEGIPVLQQLVDAGTATPQDRLHLAEAGLNFGDLTLAERETTWLLAQNEKSSAALYILARIRLAQDHPADAALILQKSLDAGGDSNATLLLAHLKLAANTPETTADAIALLRPLITQNNAAGITALLTLLNSPTIELAEAATWIEMARAHPLVNDEQKLALANAEIRLNPSSAPETFRRTIEEFRKGTPTQRVLLGRWLNQNHKFADTLHVISAAESLSNRDLFLIRLDAMAGQGNWKEISTVLQNTNLPLQTPIVMLYRGRAAKETGDPTAATTFYYRALRDSTLSSDVLWYVIRYLQRIGEHQILEQELTRMTSNPTLTRQAFEALVPLVQARQNADELYVLYERMIQLLPHDPAAQNDLRYFAALTRRHNDLAGAQALVNTEPRMLAYRITLALTLLREGKSAEALRVFDGVTLDPSQIQPYQRAVLAAVLGANGREVEARQLATHIPNYSLTAPEMEIIQPWRTNEAP